jgi:hypothetical protein
MSITDVVVILVAPGLTAVLWRFFFGVRRSSRAELRGGAAVFVTAVMVLFIRHRGGSELEDDGAAMVR